MKTDDTDRELKQAGSKPNPVDWNLQRVEPCQQADRLNRQRFEPTEVQTDSSNQQRSYNWHHLSNDFTAAWLTFTSRSFLLWLNLEVYRL